MPYYCTECKKHHTDAYKKHWKYKKVKKPEDQIEFEKMIDDLAESEPQAFVNAHEIAGLEIRLDKLNAMTVKNNSQYIDVLERRIAELEKTLGTIIGILIHWKGLIDRKHPYADAYQELFEDL